jgi:chorismate mutase
MRDLRRRIDELDRQIVRLVNERSEVARSIGRIKATEGADIRDAEREREVLLRVTMANEGPVAQADLIAIYERLIEATRSLEQADRERGARLGGQDAPGGGPTEDPPDRGLDA